MSQYPTELQKALSSAQKEGNMSYIENPQHVLRGLLAGDINPKNELVVYQLGELKKLHEEFQVGQANLQELRRQLQERETQLIRMQGAIKKTENDIIHFQTKKETQDGLAKDDNSVAKTSMGKR